MSDSEPAREPGTVPMPRNMKEFKQWVKRANMSLVILNNIKASRDEALKAVFDSFEPALEPHESMYSTWLAGVQQFAIEHEDWIKRRYGRTYEFEVFALGYPINPESVTAVSDPELVRHLEEKGFSELIRVEKAPNRTAIKTAYHHMRPRWRRTLLRKTLRAAGADVAKHQVISLSLPASVKPKKPAERKPLILQERRYPALPPGDKEDI